MLCAKRQIYLLITMLIIFILEILVELFSISEVPICFVFALDSTSIEILLIFFMISHTTCVLSLG
jgi:hypothetical protein